MKKIILHFISVFLLSVSGYAQLSEGKAGTLDWLYDHFDGTLFINGSGAIRT